MKIIITTGIFPPDIGGPANYAKNLAEELSLLGHKVVVIVYGAVNKSKSCVFKFKIVYVSRKFPAGIRHLFYFIRVVVNIRRVSFILALDTFSAGLPAVFAAKIFKKKIILRTGGDFLWEKYVERTGDLVLFRNFYSVGRKLNFKEKIIFKLTKTVLKNCSRIVFSTAWQKRIFVPVYNVDVLKTDIVENFYGPKIPDKVFNEKNFICASRNLKWKNLELLKYAFKEASAINKDIKLEIITETAYSDVMKKIEKCYAVILSSLGDISPNFILDAIRLNKPFILTKETGLYEKLKETGIFVDPLSIEDVKNKILFLADDKNYAEYKNRVLNFNFVHSWREIANEFLKIYENIKY